MAACGVTAALLLAGCQEPGLVGSPEPGSTLFRSFQRAATDEDRLPEKLEADVAASDPRVRKVGSLDGTGFYLALTDTQVCLLLGSERPVNFSGSSVCAWLADIGTPEIWLGVSGEGFVAVVVPASCAATFPDQQVEILEDVRVTRAVDLHGTMTCEDGQTFPIDLSPNS